jgi:hypothetical protein
MEDGEMREVIGGGLRSRELIAVMNLIRRRRGVYHDAAESVGNIAQGLHTFQLGAAAGVDDLWADIEELTGTNRADSGSDGD